MLSLVFTVADAEAIPERLPTSTSPGAVEWIVVVTDGGIEPLENGPQAGSVRSIRRPAESRSASWNAGLMAARGDDIAFLDDPRHYFKVMASLPGLTDRLSDGGAVAVDSTQTGPKPVATAWSHADSDWLRLTVDLAETRPLLVYSVRALRAIGGFDSWLGPGTPARGGDVLDVLIRLAGAGGRISIAPTLQANSPTSSTAVTNFPGLHGSHRRGFLAGVQVGAALGVGALSPRTLRTLSLASRTEETGDNVVRASSQRLGGCVMGALSRTIAHRLWATDTPAWSRVWCGVLDLDRPAPPDAPLLTSDAIPYDSARFLVRASGRTLGFVTVALTGGLVSPAALALAVDEAFGSLPVMDAASPATTRGPVPMTVAVCTRNRAHVLEKCLNALSLLEPAGLEILIVDNAPSDGSTEALVRAYAGRDARFRYVREPQPGLSHARNRALEETRTEVLAFTDDDVIVDGDWLDALIIGFDRSPQVGCVTGLVASASLETAAEQYFDQRVWWSSRLAPRVFTREPEPGDPGAYPFTTGAMGTGANVAFRRTALLDIGGFDETLGAGAPTAGGEDIDIFARLLFADYAISYEPDAVVWHEHRVDDVAARQQLRGYGSGLAAYLLKYLMAPSTRLLLLRRLGASAAHARTLSRRAHGAQTAARTPRGFATAELGGLIAGPRAYLRARSRQPIDRRIAVRPR